MTPPPPPPMPPPTHSARRAEAYRRLGVAPNDVLLAPKITPLLRRISADGNLRDAILYLRASSDAAARKFIMVYDDPTTSAYARKALPLEAFVLAAGVDPESLLQAIARVAHLHGAMEGAITAAKRYPEVVTASLNRAVEADGVEDRMANLKHMGYLPSPKGSSVNVNVNANATAAAASQSASASLPAPEDTIRRIIEATQRETALKGAAAQHALPAESESSSPSRVPAFMPRQSAQPVTVDAEYEEADD